LNEGYTMHIKQISVFSLLIINAVSLHAMEISTSSWHILTPDAITKIAALCDSKSRNQLMRVSKALSYLASKKNMNILHCNPLNISKKDTIYYLIIGSLKNDFTLLDNLLNNNINPHVSNLFTNQALSSTEPITKTIIQNLLADYHVETISLSDSSSYYILAIIENIKNPHIFFLTTSNDNYIKEQYPPSSMDNLRLFTVLSCAIRRGYEDVVKFFLASDTIQINEKDVSGNNALHIATTYGHTNIVKLLLTHSDINIHEKRTLENLLAFHIAVCKGYLEIVKLLLTYDETQLDQEAEGFKALHAAACNGQAHCIEYLLTYPNVDVNAQTHEGCTALYIATQAGHIDAIKALLKQPNVNVNAQDIYGCTALHIATRKGNIDAIKALLQRPDIDIKVKDVDLETPLDTARRKWRAANLTLYQEIKALLLPDTCICKKCFCDIAH
jgi:ankyrin repeat protein